MMTWTFDDEPSNQQLLQLTFSESEGSTTLMLVNSSISAATTRTRAGAGASTRSSGCGPADSPNRTLRCNPSSTGRSAAGCLGATEEVPLPVSYPGRKLGPRSEPWRQRLCAGVGMLSGLDARAALLEQPDRRRGARSLV
ncbi:MAG: hypothetical protein ACR2NR_10780 [Solirubrobacteraceae bacterium]